MFVDWKYYKNKKKLTNLQICTRFSDFGFQFFKLSCDIIKHCIRNRQVFPKCWQSIWCLSVCCHTRCEFSLACSNYATGPHELFHIAPSDSSQSFSFLSVIFAHNLLERAKLPLLLTVGFFFLAVKYYKHKIIMFCWLKTIGKIS